MGRLCRDNTKTSLAANRTRESRPSGMRGGLAETWAMGQLGTHLAIERASVGNSPPKVIRAAFLPDEPRPEPDSGKPTVRDRRGACGTVNHGGTRHPLHNRKGADRKLSTYRCARRISIPTTCTCRS